MSTIEERLAEQLDQKDEEIEELHGEIQELENRVNQAESGWCLHREVEDEHPELPLPRLEMTWTPHPDYGWRETKMEYRLVMRHYCDHIMVIPLGLTTSKGSINRNPCEGDIDDALPIRDGMHSIHDAAHLNLPLYAIKPDGTAVQLNGTRKMPHEVGLKHRR